MKCNLNELNAYPNWIHNKHYKWDEFEIWWILGISEKDLLKLCQKLENPVRTVVWKKNSFL